MNTSSTHDTSNVALKNAIHKAVQRTHTVEWINFPSPLAYSMCVEFLN